MKNIRRKYQESNIMGQKLLVIIFLTVYCLLLSGIKNAAATEITDIEITDYAVKIKTAAAMKYRLHKPDDPFRIVVDLEGAGTGKFKDTIYSSKAGVTEIKLSQIKTPIALTRLDILLSSPSDVRPEIKDNTLMLYIETLEKIAADNIKGDLAKEITEVIFDKTDEGIEIVIKGDGLMPEPVVNEKDRIITIDIPMIAMKSALPKNITHPVKDIKYRTEGGKVRFNIEVAEAIEKEVFALDDEIIVDIALKQKSQAETSGSKNKTAEANPATANSNLISLDFQDADIVPILRLLGDVGKYNIVVHPEVKGIITMKLLNVPWEQALDVILKTFNLEKVVEGNVIRVMYAVSDSKKEAEIKVRQLITEVFTIEHADVSFIEKAIRDAKVLSNDGGMGVIRQYTDTSGGNKYKDNEYLLSIRSSGSIIITDVPSVIEKVREIITKLDKRDSQIIIEARIVEINSNFAKSLGVQWGLMWLSSNWRDSILGSAGSPVPGGQFPMAINLPAATQGIASPTSAITFGYLNSKQTLGIDLRISAIESIGKAKIISNPKIMALNNEMAIIKHGAQVPITTPGTTQGTFITTYKDANLKLKVIPQVVESEQSIFLKVEVNKDEPNYSFTDELGNPRIDSRSASTQVILKDGETMVIGGIIRKSESDGESGVPGFSKIPILGELFKRRTKDESNEELLVFITPRIVN